MGDKNERNYEATDTRSTTTTHGVRKKTELTCLDSLVLPTIPPLIALLYFFFYHGRMKPTLEELAPYLS